MKIALLMTFMASQATFAREDYSPGEFRPPTEENLVAVSLDLLSESKKIMSMAPKKDCEANMSVGTIVDKPVAVAPVKDEEVFCICELKGLQDKDKKFLYNLIGDYDSSSLVINTGNDNLFHGALQMNEKLAKYDGEDKGRTFSGNIDYTLTGSKGEFKLSVDSTEFGKYATVDGNKRTADGKRYLTARERNTIDIRLDRNISKDEQAKTYFIGEFRFTNETDAGKYSVATQKWWHRFNKETLNKNIVQYAYVKEKEDSNNVAALIGLGKEWTSDIGKWKCQTRLEAKGGMSVDFNGKIYPEVAVRAENKVSHASVPWLAVSSWIQASGGARGPEGEVGAMISAEKKFKGVTVAPFIGVTRYSSKTDRAFSVDNGKSSENYYMLGVKLKW